jgi:hypothetical protein
VLPALIWGLAQVSSTPTESYVGPYVLPGLVNDGNEVTNLYGYDELGNRIDRVRLFNQDGRPISLSPEVVPNDGIETMVGPIETFPHAAGVFDGWASVPTAPGEPTLWTPPVAIVPLPEPVTTSSAGVPSAPPSSAATSVPGSPTTPASAPSSTSARTPAGTPSTGRTSR